MPKARKPSSVTDSDVGDTEVMAMRFVELLKDERVLTTLRSALYPQALSDKLDKLTEICDLAASLILGRERTLRQRWSTLSIPKWPIPPPHPSVSGGHYCQPQAGQEE